MGSRERSQFVCSKPPNGEPTLSHKCLFIPAASYVIEYPFWLIRAHVSQAAALSALVENEVVRRYCCC
jgi:hypothetical protein